MAIPFEQKYSTPKPALLDGRNDRSKRSFNTCDLEPFLISGPIYAGTAAYRDSRRCAKCAHADRLAIYPVNWSIAAEIDAVFLLCRRCWRYRQRLSDQLRREFDDAIRLDLIYDLLATLEVGP